MGKYGCTRGNGEAQPRIRNHRDLSENPTTSEYVSNENFTEGACFTAAWRCGWGT